LIGVRLRPLERANRPAPRASTPLTQLVRRHDYVLLVAYRKFDYEEARRLRAEGLSYAEIGRRLSVSRDAIGKVFDPQRRARAQAAAVATMRRQRRAGQYRHHDLDVCPRCLGVKSRHGVLCRTCRGQHAGTFGWRIDFTREPEGDFSWWLRDARTGRVLQSGVAGNWDDARLAAIVDAYPPSAEAPA
jgi:hypothetical protein